MSFDQYVTEEVDTAGNKYVYYWDGTFTAPIIIQVYEYNYYNFKGEFNENG